MVSMDMGLDALRTRYFLDVLIVHRFFEDKVYAFEFYSKET